MEDDNCHILVLFSLDAPYFTTGEMEDVPSEKISLDWPGCDESYLTPKVSEMPTDEVMVKLVRSELEALFHEKTAEMIRYDYLKRYRLKWWSLVSMNYFDETLPTLPDGHFQPWDNVEDYFNKHFAIYFQCTNPDKEDRFLPPSDGIGRYIYRYWLQMHRGRPPFQRHHFLAAPIEFSSGRDTFEKTHHLVTDLPYVLAFHKSLCNNVVSRENYIIPDERRRCKVSIANAVSQNTTGKKYPRLRSPGFAPCPSEGPLSYREHGFRLGHLFRSLFMVADGSEDDPAYYPKESEKWRCSDYSVASAPERGRFQLGRFEHMEKWVDWRRSRYRVLLVRTGDDSCLSAPISFQPLFDSGRTLPIGRNDYGSWEDAVRVRLDHALEFIEDLIRREKEALPHVRQAAETLDAELDELCEQWIGRVLEHAAEVGFDNNGFAWRAIRRARARLNGEAFDTYQVAPDWKWLRAWFMGG